MEKLIFELDLEGWMNRHSPWRTEGKSTPGEGSSNGAEAWKYNHSPVECQGWFQGTWNIRVNKTVSDFMELTDKRVGTGIKKSNRSMNKMVLGNKQACVPEVWGVVGKKLYMSLKRYKLQRAHC